jgi:drug/metabolite transporter (DMT)-like permease
MNGNALALVAAAVVFEVIGQLSFKIGVVSIVSANEARAFRFLTQAVGNPWVAAGVLAYTVEILLGVAALSIAPLSVVFPLLSLSYCGVALTSHRFLGERLARRQVAGILLITVGTALLYWSATRL